VCDAIADAVLRGRWIVLGVAAILAAAGAALAVTRLQLDADTNSLIEPSRPFMQRYREFLAQFGDQEHIYVAIDSRGDADAARTAADEVGTTLAAMPELTAVRWRVSVPEQWTLAPRAMGDAELEGLALAADALPSLAAAPDAATVLARSDEALGRLNAGGLSMGEDERARIGATAVMLASSVVPSADGSLARVMEPEYLRSDTNRMHFVEISMRKDFTSLSTIEGTLAGIRRTLAEIAPRNPKVEIGLTGKPVLQADELATTNADMTRGSLVATALIAALAALVFRSVTRPVMTVIAFALAFGWTYGLTTLLVGRLNLLSLVFMLVLVAAGLDYGIHLLIRYVECRRSMRAAPAIAAMIRSVTVPTWTGALTSAGTFLLALATDFGGLRELGIIAGVGLVMCALSMTVVLPALLAVTEGRRDHGARMMRAAADGDASAHAGAHDSGLALEPSGRAAWRSRARWIVAASAFALLLLASMLPYTRFESNLLKLQAEDLDSVRWEHALLEDSVSASWFAVSTPADQATALALIDRASAEPLVAQVRSAFDVVRPDTPARESMRARIASAAAAQAVDAAANATGAASIATSAGTTAPAPPGHAAPDVRELTATDVATVADRLSRLVLLSSMGGAEAQARAKATLEPLVRQLRELESELRNPETATSARERTESARARASVAAGGLLAGSACSLRDALPAAIRAKFVAPDGTLCVMLFPAADVWEFGPMKAFVGAIRSLDPNVTGVPITQFESMIDMSGAFTLMSWGSLALVALLVWIDFRSFRATAACVFALCLGVVWTLGVLAAVGIPLNMANFFGIPMLIGLGVDSSVHIVHRARAQGHARSFGSTRTAVGLASATTAIGFGTLCFAHHQGLQSLGWLMVIGSVCCFAAAALTLPAMLQAYPPIAGMRNAPPGRVQLRRDTV
jgi:predicted RND superfamily exporter protein